MRRREEGNGWGKGESVRLLWREKARKKGHEVDVEGLDWGCWWWNYGLVVVVDGSSRPYSPLHSRREASTVLTKDEESNNNPSSHADNDDDEEEEEEEEDDDDFLVAPPPVPLASPTAEWPGARAGGCIAPGIRIEAPILRSIGRMSPRNNKHRYRMLEDCSREVLTVAHYAEYTWVYMGVHGEGREGGRERCT